MAFRSLQKDQGIYLEDTDRKLPSRIDRNTRYALFSQIAEGGKAIIYSCKDLHLSRTICYKALRKELADNEIEQQRFLREARVTAMLQHPSTVPVYELGRDNRSQLYFTMKLVQGYTLAEMLNPEYRDRYDLSQLMEVVLQVARGLDFAHEHGVVHRDIKPANLLIGPVGEVLILDWGLAKIRSRESVREAPPEEVNEEVQANVDSSDLTITGQGKLQGTVIYMSPEQIRREEGIDRRSDIFSLGVVMYEILTGQPPIGGAGDRIDQVIEAVQHTEPPKPSAIAKFPIPKRLEEICLRCIRKDPKDRYQSAEELAGELRQDWD
jgi:serine/threonine protein kinase